MIQIKRIHETFSLFKTFKYSNKDKHSYQEQVEGRAR